MGNSMLQRLMASGPCMRTVSLPRGRHRLHTMPTSTGYEIREKPNYDWDGRKRGQTPFTVLQHTISGAGNLRYDGRAYRVIPGETLLVTVPDNHRYWLEPGGRWEFFWISMNGEEAMRLHQAILSANGPILLLQPETIEHLADCSYRLIHDGGEMPGRASAIAYEAAMALYDDVFGAHPVFGQEYRTMQHVLNHIADNLEKPLPVEELARVSGLSRAHFSRVFSATEGMPPAEFVMRKRLQRAAKLLTQAANLSVKEISLMSGFEEPNYFAKVFRRHFGASPTEFRTTGMYASVVEPRGVSEEGA
ncbi:AraC family transcriptional regulator [Rhizobium sp. PP-F2F-G38]|uniref:AraC family transcriptional regulator n=1 Tax=Ferranicluibacter rubi TaxID=2715133 RepID=A0AA43ZCV8_9HYPH|nr:AraC family transcriptional regulator [Ferranicluibacter rubi]PYE33961.1 AraC family transcriptional regulator [Rhizobium sp. PP-WC-1G-195]PYE94484.1 AraC family transcriptional regulator [Rhizobium sp. PP-F2F-G38]TCP80353.1 AraC family transcriptional regulator [Rhizobium sp. PP-CC-2G-626]TCQ23715.1 AraC family transcriptional regulator [Rhizobium sp. PP-CC-3G-465]NHT75492.1 AraC family transcriptional regulator [Ferranicluibacter rubi]